MTATTATVADALGGLGLFLLGMWLMTDGLKLAAGPALSRILATGTRTPLRGLAAGALVTCLVQSSSGVTVATIGFANAGLLTLERAVWVIFGANVGTTATGWLVALVGFQADIARLALPLIGAGMFLRLTGVGTQRAAWGQAAAGFGVLFLGIGVLKEALTGIALGFELPAVAGHGIVAVLIYVPFGFVLTTLMQSSSAALVIVLGAAQGGLVTVAQAAAVVIGANLGTTTTALFAAWGATSTAKRVAGSQVLFNATTAVFAVLTLQPMLSALGWIEARFSLEGDPATTLALFHTAFNTLGVALMWPLAPALLRVLERRFVVAEEDEGRPQHLDPTVLGVPTLAAAAVIRELQRLGAVALRAALAAISAERASVQLLHAEREATRRLSAAISAFIVQMSRTGLSQTIAEALPELLQVAQRYELISELAVEIGESQARAQPFDDERTATLVRELKRRVAAVIEAADTAESASRSMSSSKSSDRERMLPAVDEAYEALRTHLLRAGAEGRLAFHRVENLLEQARFMRRAAERAAKAATGIDAVSAALGNLVAAPAVGEDGVGDAGDSDGDREADSKGETNGAGNGDAAPADGDGDGEASKRAQPKAAPSIGGERPADAATDR